MACIESDTWYLILIYDIVLLYCWPKVAITGFLFW